MSVSRISPRSGSLRTRGARRAGSSPSSSHRWDHIAGVIPLVVVLAENGPYAAIIVVIEIFVYQQVENHYLNPRIRRRHSS